MDIKNNIKKSMKTKMAIFKIITTIPYLCKNKAFTAAADWEYKTEIYKQERYHLWLMVGCQTIGLITPLIIWVAQ